MQRDNPIDRLPWCHNCRRAMPVYVCGAFGCRDKMLCDKCYYLHEEEHRAMRIMEILEREVVNEDMGCDE